VSRLAAIEARRLALLREIDISRGATRLACARVREGFAPIALGFAAWQVVNSRGWLRAVAWAPAALVLVRRVMRARRPEPHRR